MGRKKNMCDLNYWVTASEPHTRITYKTFHFQCKVWANIIFLTVVQEYQRSSIYTYNHVKHVRRYVCTESERNHVLPQLTSPFSSNTHTNHGGVLS